MEWHSFNTHNDSYERAFEALCVQLFEKWIYREYPDNIMYFSCVNGAGGDGGVEAYAELNNNQIIGIQAKWFLNAIQDSEISQIKKSIFSAVTVRPTLNKYIVCIPRNLSPQTIRRGGKLSKNYEERRWNDLISEIKSSHLNLEIELWNDNKITSELQYSVNVGIQKYWFKKSIVSIKELKRSFELAKTGWLEERYIPSLHQMGFISEKLKILFWDRAYRKKSIDKIDRISHKLHHAYDEIQICISYEIDDSIKAKFVQLSNDILDKSEFLSGLRITIECGYAPSKIDFFKGFDEIGFVYELKNKNRMETYYQYYSRACEALIDTDRDYPKYEINSIIKNLKDQCYIFIGDPGTGKTHGLANAVERRLAEGFPAIIIRAKNSPVEDGWGAILRNSYRNFETWNEEEIWNVFEAICASVDISRTIKKDKDQLQNQHNLFLICVDGIDETVNWNEWKIRINELVTICKNHRRLRFCVSWRPYFTEEYKIPFKTFYIDTRGDVDVGTLFPDYIKHYDIDVSNVPWIRWALRTPYALKLFCDIYKNSRIQNFKKVETTINKLLEKKIENIEKELKERINHHWSPKDKILNNFLMKLAQYFLSRNEINRNDICSTLRESQRKRNLLSEAEAGEIVDFLSEYNIITEFNIHNKNNDGNGVYYQFSNQMITNYLIAKTALNRYFNKKITKMLPVFICNFLLKYSLKNVIDNIGALKMASIILLSDYNLLIGKDIILKKISKSVILDLQLFTLSQVLPDITSKYKDLILDEIKKSTSSIRNVIRKLVIPAANIEKHPLGPVMIHEYLKNFENAATRDIYWSGPGNLEYNQGAPWEKAEDNPIVSVVLSDNDHWTGLPLLFAWSLTSVENKVRKHCQVELTKWGIKNPSQFIKLIEVVFETNDPQMREDLALISYGITLLIKDLVSIKNLQKWAIDNIFSDEKIVKTNNIVIRHAGRGILERAQVMNIIEVRNIEKFRPPYPFSPTIANLDIKYLSGDIDEYNNLADYDLDRYVIHSSCDNFFEIYRNEIEESYKNEYYSNDFMEDIISGKYGRVNISIIDNFKSELAERLDNKNKIDFNFNIDELSDISENDESAIKSFFESYKTEENTITPEALLLLSSHAEYYKLEDIKYPDFISAYVMAYVKKLGWNIKEFCGEPKGGEEGEILGADIAILRKYRHATHGSKSITMSFREKYIWTAIHDIQGYFADRLRFYCNYSEWRKIDNYLLLANIHNPAQEIFTKQLNNMKNIEYFYNPNNIIPEPGRKFKRSVKDIKDWIDNAQVPDFDPWIYINNANFKIDKSVKGDKNWICLYSYTFLTEKVTKCQSLHWINSFILDNNSLKLLERDLNSSVKELKNRIGDHVYDTGSRPECDCYMSPIELIHMPWIPELEDEISLNTISDGNISKIKLRNGMLKIVDDSPTSGEIYYEIPSLIIRNLMQIQDGDGKRFYNETGELVCFSFDVSGPNRDGQFYLLIEEQFFKELEKNGLNIVWVFRLFREPDYRDRKELSFDHFRDRTWIVFRKNGKYISHLVSDGSPNIKSGKEHLIK